MPSARNPELKAAGQRANAVTGLKIPKPRRSKMKGNIMQPGLNYKPPSALSAGAGPLTMSSREIADLVQSRHDKVKQSIERLVARGVIVQSPMGDEQDTDAMGRPRITSVYRLDKRSSFVVVAQLSPEFTARLVDRWQQLEDEKASGGFLIPRTFGDALQLAADQARQIDGLREVAEAHERLTGARGSLCITDAAKALGVGPKMLFDWLFHHHWIFRRDGGSGWLGYEAKCAAGLLEHRAATYTRSDGSETVTRQVRVTAKGLSRLAKLINPIAEVTK
ncbi:phage antirepressor KilAC domain-containing protein [Paracoccus siganidrum]|nr:phage antirepressor KilAC domain-containing protein [Paracoccus siganidrum]